MRGLESAAGWRDLASLSLWRAPIRVPGISDTRLLAAFTTSPAATTIPLPPCPSASLAFLACSGLSVISFHSVILGRAIKNEYLALGTIFGTVGLSMLAMGGGKKEAAKPTLEQVKEAVPIHASSRCVVLYS